MTLSSSGYGDDESMAPVPAFDPLLQALGGIMAAQGGDDEPVFLTVAIHDVVTPLISAFGLVAGLYHRERTGRPQRVRTSLAQTAMAVQAAEHTRYAGAPPPLRGGFDYPGPGDGRGFVKGPTASCASATPGPACPSSATAWSTRRSPGTTACAWPPTTPSSARSPSSASWWWAPALLRAGARCSTSTGPPCWPSWTSRRRRPRRAPARADQQTDGQAAVRGAQPLLEAQARVAGQHRVGHQQGGRPRRCARTACPAFAGPGRPPITRPSTA